MRKLDQKLVRDLWRMKGQAFATILVITAGVATFVMSMCSSASLESSKATFYQESRFADIFSTVRRCPKAVASRLRSISGVSAVETRLVYDVFVDVPDMKEPATARLISVPDRVRSELNKLYIARGRMIEPGRTGEIVISQTFADAHSLVAGDFVTAIINGRQQELSIVGVALSPEYVIQIQPGGMLPDDKRFGVFWINERDLEAAFDMSGAFNSACLKLAYGGNQHEVIEEIDRLLKPYGGVGAYGRDQQISHQYLSDELSQLRGMALVAPAIFLSVAAFLLNIIVSRIISQQREQIAALKAFGYTNHEVGVHYLNLVLVISLIGSAAGLTFGFWMAANVTETYQKFYKFPLLVFQIDKQAVLSALLLTSGAGILGTWWSVRKAVKLPPAEAMRPEAPPSHRRTILERCLPTNFLSTEIRMIVRNIARRPLKAGLSVVGIAMAISVMILGHFSLDAVNYIMDFQFRKAQRQDLTVTFIEPTTASVLHEMRQLRGILDSEMTRGVATRIRYQNRSRRVGVMGLETDPQLYRLLNTSAKPVQIPETGIMLNDKLARLLGAGLGDLVTIEVLEHKRPTVVVEVTGIVEEYSGVNAYMNKQRLHSLLQESSVASGAFLRVDANRMNDVFNELRSRPGVGSVAVKEAVIDSFQKTIAENLFVMRSFIVGFAAVIAIGVVYNSARISLSEQRRDLATMRVVGFTRREVTTVLLGEIALLTIAAIPVGWLVGYLLAAVMCNGLDTDNYRIPLIVSRGTYALATVVVVTATMLSGLLVQRRIKKLDLVAVLKTRE